MRWVLRHEQGYGVQVTLDGRLGRMDFEPAERILEEEVERPPALPEEELEEEAMLEDEEQYDLEDFR